MRIYFYVVLLCLNGTLTAQFSLPDFANRCLEVTGPQDTPLTREIFFKTLTAAKNSIAWQLNVPIYWHNPQDVPLKRWSEFTGGQLFTPYVERKVVPPGSKVYIWGDIHGDANSLLRTLLRLHQSGIIDDSFRIIQPDVYLLFLGDYVDRGPFGLEVLYTLMRLQIANPEQVILVRGNHEDCDVNQRCGFNAELESKLALSHYPALLQSLYQFYEYLPLACYLGCSDNNGCVNYIQCCHGGIELGYDPRALLSGEPQVRYEYINELRRADMLAQLPQPIIQNMRRVLPQRQLENYEPYGLQHGHVGFCWSDFFAWTAPGCTLDYLPDRGCVWDEAFTRAYLNLVSSEKARITKIFRAHQHYGPMLDFLISNKGISPIWYDKLVTTFFSSPAIEPRLSQDCFALLYLAPNHHKLVSA